MYDYWIGNLHCTLYNNLLHICIITIYACMLSDPEKLFNYIYNIRLFLYIIIIIVEYFPCLFDIYVIILLLIIFLFYSIYTYSILKYKFFISLYRFTKYRWPTYYILSVYTHCILYNMPMMIIIINKVLNIINLTTYQLLPHIYRWTFSLYCSAWLWSQFISLTASSNVLWILASKGCPHPRLKYSQLIPQ